MSHTLLRAAESVTSLKEAATGLGDLALKLTLEKWTRALRTYPNIQITYFTQPSRGSYLKFYMIYLDFKAKQVHIT
jgi:hypothetical protein